MSLATEMVFGNGGGNMKDWEYVGTVKGATPISLPSNWKEALILIQVDGVNHSSTIHLLKDMVQYLNNGYISTTAWFLSSSDNVVTRLIATESTIALNNSKMNNADKLSTTNLYVYVR